MSKMNVGKTAALLHIKNLAEYAASSQCRRTHMSVFERNEQYVRGNQWLNSKLNEDMVAMGAIPFTLNRLERTLNQYLSLISRSLKKIGFAPTTNSKYDKQQAEVLKHWAMNVQTQNNYSDISQLKETDMLVGGLGWSEFYYSDGKFHFKYLNPRNVYPDPDDLSPRMDNQNFVVLACYKHVSALVHKYPKHKKELEATTNQYGTVANDYSPSSIINMNTDARSGNSINLDDDMLRNIWVRGKSLRIVEVFYKKEDTYYEAIGLTDPIEEDGEQIQNEVIFTTFDFEFATKNSTDGNVIKKRGTRIYKGVYFNEILLEHGAIPEQVPNQKYLPVIPIVYKRDYMGTPYGVIDNLIAYQDIFNSNMSSFMHFKDAKTVIASDSLVNAEQFSDYVTEKLNKKRSGILVKDAKDLVVLDSSKTLQHDLELMRQFEMLWEKATGIHDEYSGQINRETSGSAIQELTLNTLNEFKNSILNSYERMLISEGVLMLDTLKGVKDIEQLVRYYKTGKEESSNLNSNIALLNLEVFPDSAPNYASSAEEEKVIVTSVLAMQNPSIYLASPTNLMFIGLSEKTAYSLSEDWWAVQIKQQQVSMQAQLEMQQKQMEMQQEQQEQQGQQQNKKVQK